MMHVCTCRVDNVAIFSSVQFYLEFLIFPLFHLQKGATPLLCLVRDGCFHEHFYHGSSEVVEKLLKFGADPNLKDEVHVHITLHIYKVRYCNYIIIFLSRCL